MYSSFDVKVGAVLGAVLLILCRLTFFLEHTYLWIVYVGTWKEL